MEFWCCCGFCFPPDEVVEEVSSSLRTKRRKNDLCAPSVSCFWSIMGRPVPFSVRCSNALLVFSSTFDMCVGMFTSNVVPRTSTNGFRINFVSYAWSLTRPGGTILTLHYVETQQLGRWRWYTLLKRWISSPMPVPRVTGVLTPAKILEGLLAFPLVTFAV